MAPTGLALAVAGTLAVEAAAAPPRAGEEEREDVGAGEEERADIEAGEEEREAGEAGEEEREAVEAGEEEREAVGAGEEEREDVEAAELGLVFSTRTAVVTPTKTSEPLVRSPFAVSSLDGEDVGLLGALNVADALRTLPGVFVMDAGGGDFNVSIRGAARQFDERIVYLVDGQSTSYEALGVVLWPLTSVPSLLLGRIEVLRGAGSPVHGQNALSGVVQVMTRSPGEILDGRERAVEVDGRLGDQGRAGATVLGAARAPLGASYRVHLDWDRLSGYSDREDGEVERVAGAVRWDLPFRRSRLHLQVGGGNARSRILGTTGAFRHDPVENLFGRIWLELEGGASRDQLTLSTTWNVVRSDIELLGERVPVVAVLANPADVDPRLGTEPILVHPSDLPLVVPNPLVGVDQEALLRVFDAEAYGTLRRGDHELTGGASLRIADAVGAAFFRRMLQVIGSAYVQEQWRPNRRVHLVLGSRFDVNSVVGTRLSPRAAFLVTPHRDWALRGSMGVSFRDPSVFDLRLRSPGEVPVITVTPSGPQTASERLVLGNEDLRPEVLESFEIGLRTRRGSIELEVDGFAARLDDGIRNDPMTFRKTNDLTMELLGIEAALWLRLGDRLRAQASYTRQEVVRLEPAGAGPGTPEHLAGGALVVRLGDVLLAPSFTVRSSLTYDLPPPVVWIAPRAIASYPGFEVLAPARTSARVPGRLELGATVHWRPRPGLELGLVARNLLGSDAPDFPTAVPDDVLGARLGEPRPTLVFGTLRIDL